MMKTCVYITLQNAKNNFLIKFSIKKLRKSYETFQVAAQYRQVLLLLITSKIKSETFGFLLLP